MFTPPSIHEYFYYIQYIIETIDTPAFTHAGKLKGILVQLLMSFSNFMQCL